MSEQKKEQSLLTTVTTVLLSVLMAPVSTNAQQSSDMTGNTLEEIVVTAQRRVQNLQEVPVSVTVFNAEQLGRAQVNLITDLAIISPSLNFTEGGNTSVFNFSMRGIGSFAPQPAIQPAVGLLIDGIPVSRQTEFNMDANEIESVELITGPQGTLFGTNATGGVINIRTKQPTDSFEGYVELSATEDEEFIGRLAVSGPLTERVRGRALFFRKDFKGFVKNLFPGAPMDGYDDSRGVVGKLDIDVADNINLKLRGEYAHRYDRRPDHLTTATPAMLTVLGNGDPVLGQQISDDPSVVNTDFTEFSDNVKTWNMAADLTWDLGNDLVLKSISSYRDMELGLTLDGDLTPATPANPQGLPRVRGAQSNLSIAPEHDIDPAWQTFNTVKYFTQEFRLERTGSMFDWVIGGFYTHHFEIIGNELPTVNPAGTQFTNQPRRGDVELTSWSGFGDVTWHITDALSVFGGLRWTQEEMTNDFIIRRYSAPAGLYTVKGLFIEVDPSRATPLPTSFSFLEKTSPSEWSGRAGAMWNMTSDVNIYGSVARGYTGVGAVTSPVQLDPKDPFVHPSVAESYELGAKSTLFDNRMRLNVALFTTQVNNLQATAFGRGALSQDVVTFNAGSLESTGFEFDLTALIGEQFTLTGAFTLMDTELGGDVLQACYPGQTAAQGCGDFNGDGTADQIINGKPSLISPDIKYNISGTYDLPFASMPFDGYFTAAYTWRDGQWFDLLFGPEQNFQESYGLFDMTFGITDKQGKYEVSVFGKNVFDKSFSVARVGGTDVFPRAAHAYWGVKGRYNF